MSKNNKKILASPGELNKVLMSNKGLQMTVSRNIKLQKEILQIKRSRKETLESLEKIEKHIKIIKNELALVAFNTEKEFKEL